MTNDEINTKIARLHGWSHFPPPAMPAWQRPTDHGVEVLWDLPDYAGDISEAMLLVDEIAQDGYDIEIRITIQKFGGSRIAIGTDYYTLARALCSLYMTYRDEHRK